VDVVCSCDFGGEYFYVEEENPGLPILLSAFSYKSNHLLAINCIVMSMQVFNESGFR
jgi:hypothetical protein